LSRLIKVFSPETRVIVCSDYDDLDFEQVAILQGADGFLFKSSQRLCEGLLDQVGRKALHPDGDKGDPPRSSTDRLDAVRHYNLCVLPQVGSSKIELFFELPRCQSANHQDASRACAAEADEAGRVKRREGMDRQWAGFRTPQGDESAATRQRTGKV